MTLGHEFFFREPQLLLMVMQSLKHRVPAVYLTKELLNEPEKILVILRSHNIQFIVLAGYLKLMPVEIINAFRKRIVNIHPALLPKFGGKGMYGMRVHEAVCNAQETETGITIHHVNEQYDEGAIILQKNVMIDKNDSSQSIADKIHLLEMENFPKEIEKLIIKMDN